MNTDCCPAVCAVPISVSVPGIPGQDGSQGVPGSDGQDAFSVVAAPGFTVPALGGSVVIPIGNNSWLSIGQPIFVQTGGYYSVASKTGLTSITATLLNSGANTGFVGVAVAAGSTISASGPSGASLASMSLLTDNTGGTATNTLAAGVGVTTIALFISLADLANADLLTTYTPGYAFKILALSFGVEKAATTAAKAATLTPKISGVAVTGGVLALTSANCTPQGTVVAGTAVTAANTGGAAATISITGSAVTAFVEGGGWILIQLMNTDTNNAIASLAAKINAIKNSFP